MSLAVDLFLIFFLRLLDVGMATVRIVLLGRGKKGAAAALGFVEAMVWVIAIARVINGLDDPARMIAFAAGFASGTYLGAKVEEWMALGQVLIRVVTPLDTPPVAGLLRDAGFGATVVNGDGMSGEVEITFSVVPRKKVKDALAMIQTTNRDAYVTVEQSQSYEAPSARHERDVRK